ncbi:thioesterase family protein [Dermatobacter hominis]|uniref:thioesterase family protein n=1 Tax=Dermatobacter hominis TaxID=2884263 RepID=UPI001D0FB20E|nr:thioesterase family protein [Dermatobacter hominis]UDY37987.1 thioesterase family protein [Dermatobacter hominis]
MAELPLAADVAPALFVPADGAHGDDVWQPTDLTRGPWDPRACHGGAPAALITRALEAVPLPESKDGAAVPMRLARVTIELVRPVPTTPLRVAAHVIRPGRRISLLEATLSSVENDDAVVVMARALRIRTADVALHDGGPGGAAAHGIDDVPPPVPPVADDVNTAAAAYIGFHNGGTEHRFVRGSFHVPGPVFDWIRLAVPVVPDEVPSPWQRASAAADFGNGIASSVGFGEGLFINPDLNVHLWREPVGEWIGMESVMRTSTAGIGLSDSAMWDEQGRIGRGNQSLLLDTL